MRRLECIAHCKITGRIFFSRLTGPELSWQAYFEWTDKPCARDLCVQSIYCFRDWRELAALSPRFTFT